jgi:hypothetical protein
MVYDFTAMRRAAISPRRNGHAIDRQSPRQKEHFVGSRISEANGNQPDATNQAVKVSSRGLDTAPARQSSSREVPSPRADAKCTGVRDTWAVGYCILRQEASCFFRPAPAGQSYQPSLRRAHPAALVVRWWYRVPSDARFRR